MWDVGVCEQRVGGGRACDVYPSAQEAKKKKKTRASSVKKKKKKGQDELLNVR